MQKKPTSQANPAWSRDEIILALDVYFRFPPPRSGPDAAKAIDELSQLLRKLPIHPERPDQERFRNKNGVSLKLSNLQYHDIDYSGGSPNGGALDGLIFKEFQNNRQQLCALAQSIRENVDDFPTLREPTPDFDEVAAPEGRVLLRLHKQRERNQNLVKQRKEKALMQDGSLRCEVCLFDFSKRYGVLGEGFIECHHVRPVSELKAGEVTKLKDLALVCANCHRMLHCAGDVLSIEELKAIFSH